MSKEDKIKLADKELIECLKSFIRSNHLTNNWNIFRETWVKLNSINENKESS